jgi:uncharacterized protein YdeI (YjbR/CyaY-like superfamily)
LSYYFIITHFAQGEAMETLNVGSLAEWQEWLEKNHYRVSEVWLIYDRAQPGLRYEETVEEALCYGWVDSLIKNLDEHRHARKFTPRKPGSKWSALNISRAERMIAQGRMTVAGQRLYDEGKEKIDPNAISRKEQMEAWRMELMDRLDAGTLILYARLPPSLQRQYAGWVLSAKLEETRKKRLVELSAKFAKGERLGLK